MAGRDKYGNYVNEEGVIIKITTDRNGKDHISFYGSDVDKEHDAAHVNVDYEKKLGIQPLMDLIKVTQNILQEDVT